MKLNIIRGKNRDGETCVIGWNFEAENEQEENNLSIVRNHIFFGLGDTYPKYAGRQDNPESNLVKRIWYKIPENITKMKEGEINCEDKEAEKFFNSFF